MDVKTGIEEIEKRIEGLLSGASGASDASGASRALGASGASGDSPDRRRITVAIDGMSCGGKSTLADLLAEKYDGQVIHMDDFFLPMELRSEERLTEAGGNVHYERFAEEVVPFLKTRSPFSYGKFCCGKMKITDRIKIDDKPLLIVEGAYSLRPEFQPFYDIKVCITISPQLQMERLSQREGKERTEVFLNRWIPMENNYLEKFRIIEASDILIESE